MAIPKLLSLRAWQRFLTGHASHWAAMGRIAVNWPAWVARQLLMPLASLPCIVRTRSGLRISLRDDPVDDVVLRHTQDPVASLYFPGSFVPVPAGELLLDVGAHHGIYAVEALRRNPGARLVAIEPDPDGCRMLARNMALNGFADRVEVVEAAIGSRSSSGFLAHDPSGSWGNQLILDPSEAGGHSRGVRVRIVTTEEVLRGRVPHTVKCNAEGAEFVLIPQLLALGRRPRQIVLFVHPRSGSVHDLLQQLTTAGYLIDDAEAPATGHSFHCRLPD